MLSLFFSYDHCPLRVGLELKCEYKLQCLSILSKANEEMYMVSEVSSNGMDTFPAA